MIDKDNPTRPPRRTTRPQPARREAPLAAAARRLAEEHAQTSTQTQVRPQVPRPSQPEAAVRPQAEAPAQDGWAAYRQSAAPEPPAPPAPPAAPPAAPAYAHQPSAYPAPPQAGTAPVSGEPVYSPWWKRVLAALLDALVLSVPFGILAALLGANTPFQTDEFTGEVSFELTGAYVATWLIGLVLSLVYYIVLEGGAGGATLGKMALGIQLRDAETFGPIGYGRAFARRLVASLLWWALFIPGLLDVLSPLWDRRRQTWHDKAVNGVVVDKL